MKTVYIIHGWGSSSKDNWLPWLEKELSSRGHNVIVPDMPNSEEPTIHDWVGHLSLLAPEVDENTYFIGHSIGCQTIMRFLEERKQTSGGALFVAGWFYLETLEEEGKEAEKIAAPWLETPIDTRLLRTLLPKSTLLISDNDDWGAFEENRKKFAEFVTKEVVLHNKEHITDPVHPEILTEALQLIGSV